VLSSKNGLLRISAARDQAPSARSSAIADSIDIPQGTTMSQVFRYSDDTLNAPLSSSAADAAPAATILIVDDHALLRVGIVTSLGLVENVKLRLLEASNLNDAMTIYREDPNIALVLLDLNMPDCKGLQGLKQFLETFPQARVAVISGTQDEFVIGQVRALGAVGYVTKGQAPRMMCDTVLGLLANSTGYGAGGMASNGFPRFPNASRYDRVAELGPRHLEILELVLSGCSNQEISTATGLSLGTIKNYVSTILLALDVKSRSHLISLFR
jgi:DNA-binding NarL/FixJ family response regulator